MKTEDLIKGLGRELEPVRVWKLGPLLGLAALAVGAYLALALGVFLHARADLSARLASPWFLGFAALPLAATPLALLFLFRSTTAGGQKRRLAPWPVFAAVFVAYGACAAFYSLPEAAAFMPDGQDFRCALSALVISLPVWLLALALGLVVVRTSWWFEISLATLAYWVGAAVMNAHCPFEGPGHQLRGHALLPAALALLAFLPLAALLRALGRRIARAREKALLGKLG